MKFDQIEPSADDGCIATKTDITGGIGPINRLIDLSVYDLSDWSLNDRYMSENNERCGMCGCDRGVIHAHTEIMVAELVCRNYEAKLGEY